MYKLGEYKFESFKHNPGHRANYAVLSDHGGRELGMKYSPLHSYTDEYNNLDNFSHPQIPKCYNFGHENFSEKDNVIFKEHFIVLQHYDGEDITRYYRKKRLPKYLEIRNILRYFSSIADPLQYLHSKGYVHTDIKPGHLILNPKTGIIGLIDLELAIKTGELIKGISWEYASPEHKQMVRLLKKLPKGMDEKSILSQVNIDGRADLYSVGLILYEILTGESWSYVRQSPIEINNLVPKRLNEIVMGLLECNSLYRIRLAKKLKSELECV